MSVNSTHAEYDAALESWLRARDVIAGEDAVKAGGRKYLPRLEVQNDDEYAAYRARAAFFNATARTADGYVGLIFRRPPFIKVAGQGQHRGTTGPQTTGPSDESAIERAMREMMEDADMRGTPLVAYAKEIVREVVVVGRAGSLVDWSEEEGRPYVSRYSAEDILNWRTERINGRNVLSLLVLRETTLTRPSATLSHRMGEGADECETELVEQIRVMKLVDGRPVTVGRETNSQQSTLNTQPTCQVEVWRKKRDRDGKEKEEWEVVERRVPLRLGRPLPLIPFVFHGPRHSLPDVDKLPLADVIAVNLDHYRLDADYKHGMHFTALPTAWVSGFEKGAELRIGSSVAWVTETVGATAGFLEYSGQGLKTFERALDRDERLMTVLGARLLESQKKVGETAEAIELRQSGENSILGNLALSVSASLTQVLAWAYWWNSTEELPDDVTKDQVVIELNTDFSMQGMTAQELTAVVAAWQNGALSRETMLHLFRRGEVLPEGRTDEEEASLIQRSGVKRIRRGAVIPEAGSPPRGTSA